MHISLAFLLSPVFFFSFHVSKDGKICTNHFRKESEGDQSKYEIKKQLSNKLKKEKIVDKTDKGWGINQPGWVRWH